jgi:hypothetical protein
MSIVLNFRQPEVRKKMKEMFRDYAGNEPGGDLWQEEDSAQ